MSRRYELASRVTITAPTADLDLLFAIFDDEEKRIGSRAHYAAIRKPDRIRIDVEAADATALKTVMSALSTLIRTAEEMNTIR